MTIEVPNELLESSLTLSQILVVSTTLSYPDKSALQLSQVLGTSKRNINRILKSAQGKWEHIVPPVGRIVPESGTYVPTVVSSSSGKENPSFLSAAPATSRSAKAPTKEEVSAHAAKRGRDDLVDEFFERCEEDGWMTGRGEPITNWKRWFDGWASKKPKASAPRKRKQSAEQARYEQDSSY
jgi:hypothetical protein